MSKNNIVKSKLTSMLILGLLSFSILSCGEDDPIIEEPKTVTANFSFTVDGTTVTFVNASVNATKFEWDFGDGSGTSTEENPVYTYNTAGTYTVKLSASNSDNEDMLTAEVNIASTIALFISGKTWIPVRGESLAVVLGPQDGADGWDYTSTAGTWFSWGDLDGASAQLATRASLANDEYTFNSDGTYNVNFNGDFWAEFGIWTDTDFADSDITISSNSLPLNTNGEDVSAFVSGSWNWIADEDARTLRVEGSGAHIINPRYKNEQSSYDAGTGITYQVLKTVTGTEADTLVVYIETHDNDFNSDPRQYHVLASYHGAVPELDEVVVVEPAPIQYTTSVNASDISHTFLAETGVGSGVGSVGTPYDVDYSANIGGENCTQLTKDATEADRFGNFLFFAGTDSDTRSEIDFTGGETKISLDVYMPSSNDFTGDFKNLVRIRFIDQSQYANFWEQYIELEEADIATDQWVTLTFDFTAALAAGAAESSPNLPDGVMIEFGEVNHITGGTIYVKDFKLITP